MASVRNKSADSSVSEEGEGGQAPGTKAEIPLQPVVRNMGRQLPLCSPWRCVMEHIGVVPFVFPNNHYV